MFLSRMISAGAVMCLMIGAVSADGQIIYVNDDAPAGGNGASWATAFTYLQDALAVASPGNEIHVAQGTYMPDHDEAGNVSIGDRRATLQLISGVAIYGGYAGFGMPKPDVRDIVLYDTILSGDLGGDDAPFPCTQNFPDCDGIRGGHCANGFCIISDNNSENSYHVVIGVRADATAILDGFTITAGNADELRNDFAGGGGMLNSGFDSSPSIAHCTFKSNSASGAGGAMNNLNGSSPTVTHCTFSGNASGSGGGMFDANSNTNPTVTHCTFSGNSANYGAGMFNVTNANPTVTHCTFIGNMASIVGGGMYSSGSSPTMTNCRFSGNSASDGGGMYNNFSISRVTNCTFSGNSASNSGGGMYNIASSRPTVINCTFSGNTASNSGGGMFNTSNSTSALVTNCILWANTDSGGMDESAQVHVDRGTTVVNYSVVEGGWSGVGGVGNINVDPLLVDIAGPDDIPGTEDDDLRLSAGSPCIDSGDNAAVPPDVTTDLLGGPRLHDDSATLDTGNGFSPIVDMGAFEFGATVSQGAGPSRGLGMCGGLGLLPALMMFLGLAVSRTLRFSTTELCLRRSRARLDHFRPGTKTSVGSSQYDGGHVSHNENPG